jgi:hypothetical protein
MGLDTNGWCPASATVSASASALCEKHKYYVTNFMPRFLSIPVYLVIVRS